LVPYTWAVTSWCKEHVEEEVLPPMEDKKQRETGRGWKPGTTYFF
jgi:hypothetical protein